MATEDLRSVSSVTGTFRQLPSSDGSSVEPAGKQESSDGKNVPVVEKSAAEVKELARKLNVASKSIGHDLRFEVDFESGKSVVIQVLDRETGEVIRQIPPEKADLYVSESGAMALRLYDAQV